MRMEHVRTDDQGKNMMVAATLPPPPQKKCDTRWFSLWSYACTARTTKYNDYIIINIIIYWHTTYSARCVRVCPRRRRWRTKNQSSRAQKVTVAAAASSVVAALARGSCAAGWAGCGAAGRWGVESKSGSTAGAWTGTPPPLPKEGHEAAFSKSTCGAPQRTIELGGGGPLREALRTYIVYFII